MLHIWWTSLFLATVAFSQDIDPEVEIIQIDGTQVEDNSLPQPTPWDPTWDWPVATTDEPEQPTPPPSEPPPPGVDFAPVCDLSPNSCPACDRWWRFQSEDGDVYSMYCGTVIHAEGVFVPQGPQGGDGIFTIADCLKLCDGFPACHAATFIGNDTCYLAIGSDILLAPEENAVGFFKDRATDTPPVEAVAIVATSSIESALTTSTLDTNPVVSSYPSELPWLGNPCYGSPICPLCTGQIGWATSEQTFTYTLRCGEGPECHPGQQNVSQTSFSECLTSCNDKLNCFAARYNIELGICTVCSGRSRHLTLDGEIGIYPQANFIYGWDPFTSVREHPVYTTPSPSAATQSAQRQAGSNHFESITRGYKPTDWNTASPAAAITRAMSVPKPCTAGSGQAFASTRPDTTGIPEPVATYGWPLWIPVQCPEADKNAMAFVPEQPEEMFEIFCNVFPQEDRLYEDKWLGSSNGLSSFQECAAECTQRSYCSAFVWQSNILICRFYEYPLDQIVTLYAAQGETAGVRLIGTSHTLVTATESRTHVPLWTPPFVFPSRARQGEAIPTE